MNDQSDKIPKQSRKSKAELDSRTFKDGAIYLFRRADYKKPTWFCRVKVPNAKGYVSCSTKTTDEHAAYKFADDLFHKTLIKVASGQDIRSKRVVLALKDYQAHVEAHEPASLSKTIKLSFLRRWSEFFTTQRMKEINTALLVELNEWTERNSRRGSLSPNTVKRFSTYQKQFFNWCLDRGILDNLPRFPRMKMEANRRPHFDGKDWGKLTRHLREFVKHQNPNIVRDRMLLRDFVLIMGNSGLRVGEARTLKWRDIREIRSQDPEKPADIALFVKGKTGVREVVARTAEVKTYFRRILELRTAELGASPKPDDYVFCNRDGTPIGSFKKSFAALLKSADVEADSHGNKRTIYSLRHTYATFRLQEGVHQFILAKNMGTSVAMLEKHYGHTSNVASAAELTKGARGRKRSGDGAGGGGAVAGLEWLRG